jgi:hypothetical protein
MKNLTAQQLIDVCCDCGIEVCFRLNETRWRVRAYRDDGNECQGLSQFGNTFSEAMQRMAIDLRKYKWIPQDAFA